VDGWLWPDPLDDELDLDYQTKSARPVPRLLSREDVERNLLGDDAERVKCQCLRFVLGYRRPDGLVVHLHRYASIGGQDAIVGVVAAVAGLHCPCGQTTPVAVDLTDTGAGGTLAEATAAG
jgi:hypothetical protein